MDALRVFLAHPKHWSDEDVDQAVRDLTKLYETGLRRTAERAGEPARAVQVIAGRDDFKKAKQVGKGWRDWATSVSGNLMDGRPRFHRVLIPNREIGRATADILKACIDRNRDVRLWNPATDSLVKVTGVKVRNPDSWQSGWVVVTG